MKIVIIRGRSHVASSPRGGGAVGEGFQTMTIDDKGGGGVWPMIMSSQKSKSVGILQGIFPKLSSKFTNSGQKVTGKFKLN